MDFSQTGCWLVGSRTSSGIHMFCGVGGFIAGIIITLIMITSFYYWLKEKD